MMTAEQAVAFLRSKTVELTVEVRKPTGNAPRRRICLVTARGLHVDAPEVDGGWEMPALQQLVDYARESRWF